MPRVLQTVLRALLGGVALMLWATAAVADVGKYGPYNTSSEGSEKRLMLNGFDPVTYYGATGPIRGRPELTAEFDGVVYRFSTEASKAEFLRTPEKYVPMFGGYCANGIAYAIPWGGDGDTWKLIDGKLVIFGGQASRKYFLMNEAENFRLAQKYWDQEVKGNGALWQRYKRLLFRVPHYKTGEELESEWQRSRAPAPNGNPAPLRAQ